MISSDKCLYLLTSGSVQRIHDGYNNNDFNPTVQFVDVKMIITNNNEERCRLVISDGKYYIQGMLATHLNYMVENEQIKKYDIVELSHFVCNNINGRNICIVIEFNIIAHANGQIGSPTNIHNINNINDNNLRVKCFNIILFLIYTVYNEFMGACIF